MDCSNTQTVSGIRRPQMPEPPCRNTNGTAFGGPNGFGTPGNVLPLRPGTPARPQPNMPSLPGRPPRQPDTPPAPIRPPRQPDTAAAPIRPPKQPIDGYSSSAMPQTFARQSSAPADMERLPYAMGYVPLQRWTQTYSLDCGLERGTIFPDLDLPFGTGRSRR